MKEKFVFDKAWISKYPADFVPKGARVFIGVDHGAIDYTMKGFYDPKTGEIHIQYFDKGVKQWTS